MKQSWKIRCIFILLCISIIAYLGLKRNILSFTFKEEYKQYPLTINEVMVNNRNSIRDEEGDFEGWAEVYNKGDIAVNLQGFGLSNDSQEPFMWTFPPVVIQPKSFCLVWTSGKNKKWLDAPMHTNFKLENNDEVLILTAPHRKWNDIFVLNPMGENISYGRRPDGSSKLYGFDGGTPGKANTGEILYQGPNTQRLEGPIFSHDGGFYIEPFKLKLQTQDVNAVIYYTLDGSIPTKNSVRYTKPILIPTKINKATVVRARAYRDGYPKSLIITHSYFIEENIYNTYNTPVISLVTDPEHLFGYEKGIYVAGKVFDQWKMKYPNSEPNHMTPANYNQRGKSWEREASIELYECNGTVELIQNIGFRTHGGYSRASNLKPLSLFARKDYDDTDYFAYDFFGGQATKLVDNHTINQFSRILLRTSATDSPYALFRDVFIQSLIQTSINLDTQSSQPCILYMNGKYYGIHNIREAYDEKYISNHYDMEQEDVVIIKNPGAIAGVEIQEGTVGDEMHYNRMITYVKEHDLKMDNHYYFMKTQMDIDNFIDYHVLQIYCDNRDWPGNNVRVWRKRTQTYHPNAPYGHDGRWRWMVFDLDYGFGLFQGAKASQNNSLQSATALDGPEWPNPPWSTLLLRALLNNDEFKNQFINIFADRLNTIFLPETVLAKIQAMEDIYSPNMMQHINRWNLHDHNIENWKNEIQDMKKFAIQRPSYIRQHMIEYFGLSGTATIAVEMNQGGTVRINSLDIMQEDTPWEGIYFKDIPITVQAVPKPGFVFVGWEGIYRSKDKTITINVSQSLYLKAIFKKDKGI